MSKFNFKGWKISEFLKGRKRMLVTLIGAGAGYLVTQSPQLSAIIAAGTDMVYAIIDYYVQE